jgi:hypothetical protein
VKYCAEIFRKALERAAVFEQNNKLFLNFPILWAIIDLEALASNSGPYFSFPVLLNSA